MSLQVIKSINGKDEYVLLPINIYQLVKTQIDKVLSEQYESFDVNDYITNTVTLARIKAGLTQLELAKAMGVSQAYISKIEGHDNVSVQVMNKVQEAIRQILQSQ